MYSALRPFLNRGGAGRYISRAESVERLQPVAERHLDLLRAYAAAVAAMPDGEARRRVEAVLPLLRTETAKISETILSLGGTPPSGAGAMRVAPAPDDDPLPALLDAERAFGRALRDEAEAVHHQERTRAILLHNAAASESRLDVLRAVQSA